ncbi:MAG: cytochrome P450 [Acidimicrobiales bacterium]
MATIVHDLELPELDNQGLDREASRAALEAARAQHWLARIPVGYIVTRHADVAAILSDRRFHSALSFLPQMSGIEDEELTGRQTRSILALEGDEHQRLRRLVSPAFTPRSADRLRPVMRRVIGDLVEPLLPTGRCELVGDVCEPYPIPIICELLGAPAEDWKLFSGWATDIFRIFNNDIATDLVRIKAAMSELDAYVRAMVEERRSTPADDLLSDLIAAEEAGDRLTTDELVMMCESVLMAGTDTTRNQLACSVALLSEHPDQWRALGEDPDLAKPAVEETMRYLGAVGGTARITSEDIEYRDVLFPTGTLVVTSLSAANVDPEVWDDPHRMDIERGPAGATHMSLGWGLHHCLGAALARAELQEALPLLARSMPDLEVDGEIEWKAANIGIWGPARLPLKFTPSR